MALTGYLITQYRDINPQSPTYNQIREERTLDSECSTSAPQWVEITAYCEYSESGTPTGYYIHVEVDNAKNSETYGQTREWKETAPQGMCEDPSSEPEWILDESYDNHCETKQYEPSMVVGETGRFLCRLTDENVYSPTYGQQVESALTESDWETLFSDPFPCETPNTEPDIEAISQYCETSGGANTGYLIVNGMDRNPYSSTYLTVTSAKTLDEESCPTVPPTDCDKYGWSGLTLYEDVKDNVGGAVGTSLASAGTLVLYDKPSWVTYLTANTSQDIIAYIVKAEDSDGSRRSGTVVFRSSDGNCEFSGTVIQAAQAIAVNITFTGLPSNLSSGGLMMTGSTYTAEFILAGPNAGNGTLYGTLSPSDSRQDMTFDGQFTSTSGGGNIVNACDGTSTSNIYTVYTASWDVTTNTLNVTFTTCS